MKIYVVLSVLPKQIQTILFQKNAEIFFIQKFNIA